MTDAASRFDLDHWELCCRWLLEYVGHADEPTPTKFHAATLPDRNGASLLRENGRHPPQLTDSVREADYAIDWVRGGTALDPRARAAYREEGRGVAIGAVNPPGKTGAA